MNWGKITVIILVVFVLFIGGLSYMMMSAPDDEYDHQYYENGLNFDRDYNRELQVTKDHAQPVIVFQPAYVQFTFPQAIKGQVKFMRPSSDAADSAFPLDNKNGIPIAIPISRLARGRWQLVFEWQSNHKDYLYQHEIDIR